MKEKGKQRKLKDRISSPDFFTGSERNKSIYTACKESLYALEGLTYISFNPEFKGMIVGETTLPLQNLSQMQEPKGSNLFPSRDVLEQRFRSNATTVEQLIQPISEQEEILLNHVTSIIKDLRGQMPEPKEYPLKLRNRLQSQISEKFLPLALLYATSLHIAIINNIDEKTINLWESYRIFGELSREVRRGLIPEKPGYFSIATMYTPEQHHSVYEPKAYYSSTLEQNMQYLMNQQHTMDTGFHLLALPKRTNHSFIMVHN